LFLNESLNNDQYKYEVDPFLNTEEKKFESLLDEKIHPTVITKGTD